MAESKWNANELFNQQLAGQQKNEGLGWYHDPGLQRAQQQMMAEYKQALARQLSRFAAIDPGPPIPVKPSPPPRADRPEVSKEWLAKARAVLERHPDATHAVWIGNTWDPYMLVGTAFVYEDDDGHFRGADWARVESNTTFTRAELLASERGQFALVDFYEPKRGDRVRVTYSVPPLKDSNATLTVSKVSSDDPGDPLQRWCIHFEEVSGEHWCSVEPAPSHEFVGPGIAQILPSDPWQKSKLRAALEEKRGLPNGPGALARKCLEEALKPAPSDSLQSRFPESHASRCAFCSDLFGSHETVECELGTVHRHCGEQRGRQVEAQYQDRQERMRRTERDPYTLDKDGNEKVEEVIYQSMLFLDGCDHLTVPRAELDREVGQVWENGWSGSSYED